MINLQRLDILINQKTERTKETNANRENNLQHNTISTQTKDLIMSIVFNNISQSINVVRDSNDLNITESIYQNANGEWVVQLISNIEGIECDATPVIIKNFDKYIVDMLDNTYIQGK